MAQFIDTYYSIDASKLAIGLSAHAQINLFYKGGSASTSLTCSQYDPTNTNIITTDLPYTVAVTPTDSHAALLTVTFNQPAINIYFGLARRIRITDSYGYTDIYLTVNYANQVENSWLNPIDVTSVTNIVFHGPLVSTTINKVLKSIYQAAYTAWDSVTNLLIKYSFTDRYLSDIIDLAIAANVSLDPATATVTYNADQTISSVMTLYTGKYRSITRNNVALKVNYTYSTVDATTGTTFTTTRLLLRNGTFTPQTPVTVSLLTKLSIEAMAPSFHISSPTTYTQLFNIAEVKINRTLQNYANPYLTDFDSTATVPDYLRDYKYYRTYVMTGWTVTA